MFPRVGNDQFPLPKDYRDLTKGGQREARLHVCRDCSSPEAYIVGHMFFRQWYLAPQGQAFYQEGGLLPPAQGHYLMLDDFCRYPLCVEAFPRGQGKSTIFSKELPLREICSFPYRQVVVCMASEKLIADKASPVMIQLETNRALIDDFGQGGRMIPKKGMRRVFKMEYMGLLNGSVLEMLTIGSRQRGTRTSRYILDDPEYDPKSKKQERYAELREKLQDFIEREVLYMLNPKLMKFFWIGTMLGARSYLYHVCYSKDPKYRIWTRRVQPGGVLDEKGKVVSSSWEERYPVKTLQLLKDANEQAFMTEVMNAPAQEKARLLVLDPVANMYKVDKLPKGLGMPNVPSLPDPEAMMEYHYFTGYRDDGSKKWQIDRVNQKDHFDKMRKVCTIDYAPTKSSLSDLKAFVITGIDARNTWWRLDAWAGRLKDDLFYDLLIKFCAAWRVHVIAPEEVAQQTFLAGLITRRLFESETGGLIPRDWHPVIHAVNYPPGYEDQNKGHRINNSFHYRISRGFFKVPSSYATKWPFNEEQNQFKFFTIDLSELKRDDIIDAGAMVNYVPVGRGEAAPTKGLNPVQDMITAIRQGRAFNKDFERLVGMPLRDIKPEYLAALIDLEDERDHAENSNDRNVWDPAVVVGGDELQTIC